jgi:hypothetical protein
MRPFAIALLLLASISACAIQQSQSKPAGDKADQHQEPAAHGSQVTINNFATPEDSRKPNERKNETATESKPFLTHGEMASTVIGVLVLGISFFGWLAVRRQANIMAEGLKVQEAAFSQWVVLENWKVVDLVGEALGDGGSSSILNVSFDITNRSNYPLALQIVTAKFRCVPKGQWAEESEGRDSAMLAPHVPYSFNVCIDVDEEELALFRGSSLRIQIDCQVLGETVLRKKQGQRFFGILWCGQTRPCEFIAHLNKRYDSTPPDGRKT